MKVYILVQSFWREGEWVEDVFDSREKAEAAMAEAETKSWNKGAEFEVKEFEVR